MHNWTKKYRILQSLPAIKAHRLNPPRISSYWIILRSVVITAGACSKAMFKSCLGTMDRPWTDESIQIWASKILSVINVSTRIHNPHNTQIQAGQATIIMCNHASHYDIPLSFKTFPKHSIRMLAKKELTRYPLLKQGMKYAEFPFIDRKNRTQAIQDLEHAKQLMESGIVLWIAPEGTRSKDGKLQAFKKGAFITAIQAKATIIPIGIRGARELLPAGTLDFKLSQQAEIHIGPAIDAAQYCLEQKEQLRDKVYTEIKNLCQETKQ